MELFCSVLLKAGPSPGRSPGFARPCWGRAARCSSDAIQPQETHLPSALVLGPRLPRARGETPGSRRRSRCSHTDSYKTAPEGMF